MTRAIYCFLLVLSLAMFGRFNAYAQDKTPPQQQALGEEAPDSEEAEELFGRIIERLDQKNMQHLMTAFTNYNLIETVKVVQSDVEKAIRECGKNNPELKSELETRYTAWTDALNPVIQEAEGNFENMMSTQDYATRAEIDTVFEVVDATREKSENEIEKIPVTTPEACMFLKEKMNETQTSMLSLLKMTLLNPAQMYNQASDPDTAPPENSENSTPALSQDDGESAE